MANKCEACGLVSDTAEYVTVRTVNGGLNLCRPCLAEINGKNPEVKALRAERDKLQKFKDWVHEFLDRVGVPHHPPGTHGAAGCRIGDRMDWLMARVRILEAALKPFAVFGRLCASRRHSDATHFGFPGFTSKDIPTVGDCRRAAELLADPAQPGRQT